MAHRRQNYQSEAAQPAQIQRQRKPRNKRGVIALTYIYGIGRSRAAKVLSEAGVDENKKVETWSDDEVGGRFANGGSLERR